MEDLYVYRLSTISVQETSGPQRTGRTCCPGAEARVFRIPEHVFTNHEHPAVDDAISSPGGLTAEVLAGRHWIMIAHTIKDENENFEEDAGEEAETEM